MLLLKKKKEKDKLNFIIFFMFPMKNINLKSFLFRNIFLVIYIHCIIIGREFLEHQLGTDYLYVKKKL